MTSETCLALYREILINTISIALASDRVEEDMGW
jgi:hypothetical protein